jgi:hypothetical protein
MKLIVLAGMAALLVAVATSADEPTARSAVAPETSKSDDQRSRSEGLIAKQCAQIRAEFEAQEAAYRQPPQSPKARAKDGTVPRSCPPI